MGKIKINLASGTSSEKPLINAFLENNNSYIVLDNEINGSMGLPIILVSKLDNNKLVKITDQSEWQLVKEYLKNIIAGNKVEFIKVNSEIQADDLYYTQLTLPVPSFDALKNAYPFKDEENTNITSPVGVALNNQVETPQEEPLTQGENISQIPVEQQVQDAPSDSNNQQIGIMDAPINIVQEPVPEMPILNNSINNISQESTPLDVNQVQVEMPNNNSLNTNESIANNPVADINIPDINSPVAPAALAVPEEPTMQNEQMVSPVVADISVNPTINESTVNLDNPLLNNLNLPLESEVQTTNGKELEITPTPIIESPLASTPSNDLNQVDIFKEQKEAFMQACENMFDALVKKFEKELENRK